MPETDISFTKRDVHRADPNDRYKWLTLLLVILSLIAAACSVLTATSTFPIVSGWFETAIYLEKHGLKPYQDFEFVLPPVTLIYYQLIDVVTHGNFAMAKVLGVALTVFNCGLIFFWLRRTCLTSAAATSALICFVILTCEPLYVPSDYHDIVQLFLTIFLIATLGLDSQSDVDLTRRLLLIEFIVGVCAQIVFLTKQNVGVGIAGGYGIFLIGYALEAWAHRHFRQLVTIAVRSIVFLSSFLLTGFVIMRLAAVSQSYFAFVHFLLTIQAKGSPLYVLFRIVSDPENVSFTAPAFALAAGITAFFFAGQFLWSLRTTLNLKAADLLWNRLPTIYLVLARALIFITVPLYVLNYAIRTMYAVDAVQLWNFWPATFAIAAYLLDCVFSFSMLLSGPHIPRLQVSNVGNLARIVLFGAFVYAHSLTASLNSMALIIPFAYYWSFGVDAVFRYAARQSVFWRRVFLCGTAASILTYVGKLELTKLDVPYSWWGLQEPPIFRSSEKLDLPYMAGMRLDTQRATLILSVVQEIQSNTNPSDPILTFPSIPEFYLLATRLPYTRTYVQWFDFSTNASLLPDFKKVGNLPPKIIVQMMLPGFVYAGHEGLLGRPLPQLPFANYLQCMVDAGALTVLSRAYYNVTEGENGPFRLRSSRPLTATEINQIASWTRTVAGGRLVLTGALGLGDTDAALAPIQSLPYQNAPQFGGILVAGNADSLPAVTAYLAANMHLTFVQVDDNFIVRVLRRADTWQTRGSACKTTLETDLQSFS